MIVVSAPNLCFCLLLPVVRLASELAAETPHRNSFWSVKMGSSASHPRWVASWLLSQQRTDDKARKGGWAYAIALTLRGVRHLTILGGCKRYHVSLFSLLKGLFLASAMKLLKLKQLHLQVHMWQALLELTGVAIVPLKRAQQIPFPSLHGDQPARNGKPDAYTPNKAGETSHGPISRGCDCVVAQYSALLGCSDFTSQVHATQSTSTSPEVRQPFL